jgi:hypothetical protein
MRLAAWLAGALVALASPAPAQNCDQFRQLADQARRNASSGVRSNDEAQRQAAAQYDRAYAACAQRPGGTIGARPALPALPQFDPPALRDNSPAYNAMVDGAKRQSSGMDMSMPVRRAQPPAGSTLGQMRSYFEGAAGSPNTCLQDLGRAGQFLVSNAETCRVDGNNLRSVADIDALSAQDINIGEASSPRWKALGNGTYTPDCSAPLDVGSQQDAYSECLRVNICGMRATRCSIQRIQAAPGESCEAQVSTCMAENPVPGDAPVSRRP